ncbi:MAG: hypothetical protein ACRDOM_04035 [Nocardioides sp.]
MWNLTRWQPARNLAEWPVRSQQVARRNALVASTALVERRRQHEEVEEFLADPLVRRTDPARPA